MERLSMGGATSDRLGEAEGQASHEAALSGTHNHGVNNAKPKHIHSLCLKACTHATAQPNQTSKSKQKQLSQQSFLLYKTKELKQT